MNEDFEERIWGHFTVIYDTGNVKVKELNVKPSHCLSYQKHNKRSEFWVVQRGVARVITNHTNDTIFDKTIVLNVGDTIQIPVGYWHQVVNIGKEPLIIVETQYGMDCEEEDVERKYQ